MLVRTVPFARNIGMPFQAGIPMRTTPVEEGGDPPPIDPPTGSSRYFLQSEMAAYSIPNSISGDTFYVDVTNGSDSYNGLEATYSSGTTGPFKTITKALDKYRSNYIRGGDVIKILAGIYREGMTFDFNATQIASLTASTPIKIGPYGDGEVIIDRAPHVVDWSAHDANIFKGTWPYASYPPMAVVMNGSFKAYRDKQTLEELTSEGLWYFDSVNRIIYVHTAGVNPDTLDPVIPYNYDSAEQYCVKLNGRSYIELYGITMRGAARYGFTDYSSPATSTGCLLEKCTIKWNVSSGGRFFGQYNTVRKCHVWGNMLRLWPRGRVYAANGGWGVGFCMGGYGLVEGTISHDNGGEGIVVYGGAGNVTFQDNISYDNWSVGLYLDNAPNCVYRRNIVYANNPDITDIVDEWQLPSWIRNAGAATIAAELAKIKGRLRQEGIMAGDESATNPTAHSAGFKAYDNIIVGCRRGFTTYGQATGAGLVNYEIVGNTIIMPNEAPLYGAFGGITIFSSPNNTGSVIKNNIVYSYAGADDVQPLVNFGSSSAMNGVDFDNNLYYSVNDATPFKSGVYPNEVSRNFADWQAFVPAGFEVNSINDNPDFAGTPGHLDPGDYLLSLGSPAIDQGVTLEDIAFDFNYFERTAPYDIGALEYGSEEPA